MNPNSQESRNQVCLLQQLVTVIDFCLRFSSSCTFHLLEESLLPLLTDWLSLSLQSAEGIRQRQKTVRRDLGLGPDQQEWFHGVSVLWDFRTAEGWRGWLVRILHWEPQYKSIHQTWDQICFPFSLKIAIWKQKPKTMMASLAWPHECALFTSSIYKTGDSWAWWPGPFILATW